MLAAFAGAWTRAGARPRVARVPFLLPALLALGCGGGPADARPETPPPAAFIDMAASAGDAFGAIERRLLELPDVSVGFRVTAEGAFSAELEGALELRGDDDVALTARGTFGPAAADLALRTEGGRLVGGNGGRTFDEPVPGALREAIVIGWTRMGLLHNLARLVAGAPPDRMAGGVREWVEARAFTWVTDGADGGRRGIAFDIWVGGQRTADAVLWLDEAGRPVARDQTVRFSGGEMRVRERYDLRP